MDRNLDRRVEAVVPVEDLEARARLAEIIDVMLADDRRSWQLGADADWRRTEELLGRAGLRRHVRDAEAASARGGAVPTTPGGRTPGPGPWTLARDARGDSRDATARPVEVELKYRASDDRRG